MTSQNLTVIFFLLLLLTFQLSKAVIILNCLHLRTGNFDTPIKRNRQGVNSWRNN